MRMSPLKIGFLLAGLVILLGLIYGFFFHSKPQEPKEIEQTPSTVQVTPIHSDVSVKEVGADFVTLPGQQAVESGSVIKTSDTGRALIESASSHITRLDYNSEITITEEEKQTKVALAGGALWSRLTNIFDGGESYEVQTPNAIAAVRGTSFGVWYQKNTTIVIVIEGSVLFTPIGAEDKAVLVKAGYKATRVGTGPVVVEPLTKTDRALAWVVFNADAVTPTQTTGTPSPSAPVSGTPTPTPAPLPIPVPDLVRFSGISPTSIEEGSGATLTLSGRNLDQVVLVTIDGTSVYYSVVGSTAITVSSPTSLSIGRHTVAVTGPNNRVISLTNALTVSARTVSPNGVPGKP